MQQRLVALGLLLASAAASGENETHGGCWGPQQPGEYCPFGSCCHGLQCKGFPPRCARPQCAAEGQSCAGRFRSCCGGLRCESLLGSDGAKQCVRPHEQRCVAEGQTCGGPGLAERQCCGGMRCERHLLGTHNKQCVRPQGPQCVKKGESCGCAGCQTLSCCGGLRCTESVGGGGHKFCLDSPWLAEASAAGRLRGSGGAEAAAEETLVQAVEAEEAPEAAAVEQAQGGVGSNATVAAGTAAVNETEATLLSASGGCWASQGTLRTCGTSCFSRHPRSSCISTCLQGKGVGSWCSSCLGEKSDCSIAKCLNPCARSATGAKCLQCVRDHCRSC